MTYSMRPTTLSQSASSCSPVSTTDVILPSEMTTTTTTTTTSLSHEVGVTYTAAVNPSTPSPIPVDQQPAPIPLSLPSLSSPLHSIPQCLDSTPSPFQAATLAAFTYIQTQVDTATRVISNMQAEINTLEEQLAHATQQTGKKNNNNNNKRFVILKSESKALSKPHFRSSHMSFKN